MLTSNNPPQDDDGDGMISQSEVIAWGGGGDHVNKCECEWNDFLRLLHCNCGIYVVAHTRHGTDQLNLPVIQH